MHKILREGDLAALTYLRISLLCELKLWTAPFPDQSGVANLRLKTLLHPLAVIEIAGIELLRQNRAVGTLARQRTRSRCVLLW